MCPPKDMVAYHSAHAEFQRLVEEGAFAESHTIRQKLKPGQCLVFNNRRMLHGRDVSIGGGGAGERAGLAIDQARIAFENSGRGGVGVRVGWKRGKKRERVG